MPEAYYLIPMVPGPYSRGNGQRPMYVDDIQCNWVGHNVDDLGVYVCLVNTTEAKHTDLNSRVGVHAIPRDYTWNTVISTMRPAARNFISNWCNSKNIPYDSSETIGEFLMRVINSGLYSLGNIALNTQFQNLSQTQKDKITALCNKWGNANPSATETVRSITNRTGVTHWPGNDRSKVRVEEY
jgi:hypothetical protein